MATRIGEELRQRIAAVWPDLMNDIASGMEIRKALAKNGTTHEHCRAYRAMVPGADEEWRRAKEDSADADFDEIKTIIYNPDIDPKRARVMVDALRWTAGKRNPRVYGDRATLDVNVKTVDLTKIIQDANARLANARQPQVIDGTAERVLDAPLQAIAHLL